MKVLGIVFLGGGLGSMARFAVGKWVSGFYQHPFPLGTLLANITTCFAIGLIVGLADHREALSPNGRLFWEVGFCGGLSTFSAFTHETLNLVQNGNGAYGLLYVGTSLVLCAAATFAGLLLAKGL